MVTRSRARVPPSARDPTHKPMHKPSQQSATRDEATHAHACTVARRTCDHNPT
eukprot:CAMPEP_0173233392 /NCGR_PEP_ID=MMETSP1142-20121109/9581_1 /TAXON_ID=483371 /ORGANISM="non described non described, Strain CCMP2298" /LENGTH=52 /DNA_ID=CAMNT_0014163189 /DNA_START=535 /DNA_END=689 /DNA_ORIENTATION=-